MNYDLSGFHTLCAGKSIICTEHSILIYCPVCQVLANVEAVAGKISASDACKVGKEEVRKVIGDQSPNVDKGAMVS